MTEFTPPRDAVEALDRMAELLATPEKWHRGANRNRSGTKCCLEGALNMALTGSFDQSDTSDLGLKVRLVLRAGVPPIFFDQLHKYNDSPVTTHADILALIARARAVESGT